MVTEVAYLSHMTSINHNKKLTNWVVSPDYSGTNEEIVLGLPDLEVMAAISSYF